MISGFSSATKLLSSGVALFIQRLRFLFAEFLEARIVSKRIEHRIEAEQRGASDALLFGKLWYGEPNAINNAVNCAWASASKRRRKASTKPRTEPKIAPLMKKQFILYCVGLIAVAPLCFGQATRSPSAKSDARETAISDLEISAWEAYKGKQADALKKYYATDYCGVYAEGFKTVDKEVADMEKTDLRDYSLADTKVAFPEAKVAVITYKVTMHSTFAGQDTSGTYNSASVWIKRSGKWLTVFHTETKAQ